MNTCGLNELMLEGELRTMCNSDWQPKDDPSVKYGIDAKDWVEFEKTRQTPSWQVYFTTYIVV